MAIAVLVGNAVGLHWWSIGLVVLGGLMIGELLRLGAFSSQVAISALLAYSLGSGYGAVRAIDTVVGAVIGAAVNVLVPPPSQVKSSAGRCAASARTSVRCWQTWATAWPLR